ncbi:NUDIX domain-containing protein [Candidatus Woesearchaeota archaeon]|nr:NUDIX domain-containing protein [Candidatus Woesearchaeota archaeon]
MPEIKHVRAGVGVMILRDGKVLLGKRHTDPKKADSKLKGAGTWTMPGGSLKFGESFEECARREVQEETGIKLNSVKVMCINNDKSENAHFVTIGTFSKDFVGEPRVMEPDVITEWQWFELDKLPKPMYFPSEKVVANYLRKRFYLV